MSDITKNGIYLTDGNKPESVMLSGYSAPENRWKSECWLAYSKGVEVYKKNKTFENCYLKYKLATKSNTSAAYPQGNDDFTYEVKPNGIDGTVIHNEIPVIEELKEPNNPILLGLPNKIRLTFNCREFEDNEYTRSLFKAMQDYFKASKITGPMNKLNSLFGRADTFGAHWHLGGVQQLHGTRSGWVFNFGDGENRGYHFRNENIDCTAMLANTGFDDVTFNFDCAGITIMDNMFSATKPSLWGTFNAFVNYGPHCEIQGPYVEKNTYNGEVLTKKGKINGFVPISFIKTFRASKISQEGLNNVLGNTIWVNCKDWNGAFAEKLRCWHDTIPPAYGCSDYEEHPNNTVKIGYHEYMDNQFGVDTLRIGIPGVQGSLLECFMDSSIKYCKVILDCKYIWKDWQLAKAFATYRQEEGVHPMIEVRLKNLGNLAEYNFTGTGGNVNNGKFFSTETVKYLVNNALDLREYNPNDPDHHNAILRTSSRILGPAEWEGKLTQEELARAKEKGFTIVINNITKN